MFTQEERYCCEAGCGHLFLALVSWSLRRCLIVVGCSVSRTGGECSWRGVAVSRAISQVSCDGDRPAPGECQTVWQHRTGGCGMVYRCMPGCTDDTIYWRRDSAWTLDTPQASLAHLQSPAFSRHVSSIHRSSENEFWLILIVYEP